MPTSFTTDPRSQHIHERLTRALAGRYVLHGEIGRGGMAAVFRAHDVKDDRDVAIKVLPPELATAVASERFILEVRAAARLTHPHILPLLTSDEADGLLYYVMPLVEGETLRQRLVRERRLPLDEALRIARDVADALSHAHDRGFVHRDIKPENVLLGGGRNVWVADFGLTLALLRSSDRRLTLSRHIVGTPAYMSPEQASGEAVDGRSDIYSLGCLLFEMLAGRLPFDADGDLALLAQHMSAPPPRLTKLNPEVPPGVERVVTRALAKAPADRFASGAAFVVALQDSRGGRRPMRTPTTRRWLVTAGALAVIAGASYALVRVEPVRAQVRSVTAWMQGALRQAPLDTSRYAIFPFHRRGSAADDVTAELGLAAALDGWEGIGVVDHLRVADRLARAGGDVHEPDRLARIARDLSAARFIHGSIVTFGTSRRIRVALHDARTGSLLRDTAFQADGEVAALGEPLQAAAERLLFPDAPPLDRDRSTYGTRSPPALRAYAAGWAALRRWNLDGADSALATAVRLDPEFAAAHLLLAQVRSWTADPPDGWQRHAEVAVALGAALSARERALAAALVAMARGDFPSACAVYDSLERVRPNEFASTFGIGECNRRDQVVVRDRASRSGWRFRGNRNRAVKAYRDAFEMLPPIQRAFRDDAFERIRRLLMTSTSARFSGTSADGRHFTGVPAIVADSLVLIPYPGELAVRTPELVAADSTVHAVRRQRLMFRDIAARWRAGYPDDPGTLEAMAVALELLGDPRALDTLRVARRLATDEAQRLRLAVQEAWLGVKFAAPHDAAGLLAARRLADSVLAALRPDRPDASRVTASLAVMTGRPHAAAAAARRGAVPLVRWPSLPIGTLAHAEALRTYAALGAPSDSIQALAAAVRQDVRGSMQADEQAVVLNALLQQPAVLAFPGTRFAALPGSPVAPNPILQAQEALGRGDPAGARRLVKAQEPVRATRRPADLTPDMTYAGAQVLALAGDARSAIQWLDPVLEALHLAPPEVIHRPANAGALLRMLVLRADLALAMGDTATARRWARPVTILWQHADAPLQPVVRRMEAILSPRIAAATRTH